MLPFNFLAGYRTLIDSYFDLLRKGELNPARGLLFTRLPDPATEEELVTYLVDHLKRRKYGFRLIDWRARQAQGEESAGEFRQFFGRLWELQEGGMTEEENRDYLDRLNTLMRRKTEPDESNTPYAILYNLPPVTAMDPEELDALRRFIGGRMEANLPVFACFQESYSDLLLALQPASEVIWSLDETAYPGEFYLMHPHGLRTILLQNRRKSLGVVVDPSGN